MSNLEEYLSKGQTDGNVTGKKKMWSIPYGDDVVVVAKMKQNMGSMIRRLENI